jgi:hypothetical protein
VGDAELGQRAADLGQLRLVHLAAVLGRDEVVPTPIGVERPEQAVPLDRLRQAEKARHRALLVDQERRRIDRASGVVERDDEFEIALQRRNPAMRRAVLEQQHARQRPAQAFLAVGAAALGFRRQPGSLQG